VEDIPEHAIPAGPLAVRWLAWEPARVEAGALTRIAIELENAGLVAWRDLNLAYHWLDERGNAIVWDGIRTPVQLAPGERRTIGATVRGPIPPGRYRFAVDLVSEGRFWLAELGNLPPERDVDVEPRNADGARAFLSEPVPGLSPDWYGRVRALHEEGYAAVGGSVEQEVGLFRRPDPELAPYAPGGGRNPAFAHALVCPSLLPPLEPNTEVAGLPAWRPEGDEPWLYDGRVTLRLRSRSGRRRA
jgi:hypothetical protein